MNKAKMRAELSRLTDEFLAADGKITQCPTGHADADYRTGISNIAAADFDDYLGANGIGSNSIVGTAVNGGNTKPSLEDYDGNESYWN